MKQSFEERVAEAKAIVSAVSPQEANKHRMNNSNTLFIDPRDADDINSTTGMIPDALNVPLNQLSKNTLGDLPQELSSHSRPIITACQGGPMGALAAYELKKLGFINVSYIDGGTQGWLDAGYSTIR
jgi:rhodanese-related sulfurtransferase